MEGPFTFPHQNQAKDLAGLRDRSRGLRTHPRYILTWDGSMLPLMSLLGTYRGEQRLTHQVCSSFLLTSCNRPRVGGRGALSRPPGSVANMASRM